MHELRSSHFSMPRARCSACEIDARSTQGYQDCSEMTMRPNPITALDAGMTRLFYAGRFWPGASEFEC
jgi:hypothetical protein